MGKKISKDGGIYFANNHGKDVISGKKTIFVSTRDYSGMLNLIRYCCSQGICYGKAMLVGMEKISPNQFNNLTDCHCISPQEKATRWRGGIKTFYVYPIKVIEVFNPPLKIAWKLGIHEFIHEVQFL